MCILEATDRGNLWSGRIPRIFSVLARIAQVCWAARLCKNLQP